MPKSRNKRKNKARNIAKKEQEMNRKNNLMRENRDNYPSMFLYDEDMKAF